MNKIKLITFDATGTLIKFKRPPVETYAKLGIQHGIFCSPEEIQKNFKETWKSLNKENPHFGQHWQQWWTQFVFRTFKAENDKLASELISYFSTGTAYEWHKGALQVLSVLNKFELGIISNSDPRLKVILKTLPSEKGKYNKVAEAVATGKLFKRVVLSHECQLSKPDKKIFDLARGSFHPSECIHIGDNLELDYLGAKNAGWNSLHFQGDFSQLTQLII